MSLLIQAIKENDLEAVRRLLTTDENNQEKINNSEELDENGHTPLQIALNLGYLAIFKELLKHTPQLRKDHLQKMFMQAAREGQLEFVKYFIIEEKLSPFENINGHTIIQYLTYNNAARRPFTTPMKEAIKENQTEIIAYLFRQMKDQLYSDLSKSTQDNDTSFLEFLNFVAGAAAEHNKLETLKVFLNKEPVLLPKIIPRFLPHAIKNGHLDVLNFLVNNSRKELTEQEKMLIADFLSIFTENLMSESQSEEKIDLAKIENAVNVFNVIIDYIGAHQTDSSSLSISDTLSDAYYSLGVTLEKGYTTYVNESFFDAARTSFEAVDKNSERYQEAQYQLALCALQAPITKAMEETDVKRYNPNAAARREKALMHLANAGDLKNATSEVRQQAMTLKERLSEEKHTQDVPPLQFSNNSNNNNEPVSNNMDKNEYTPKKK